MDRAGDPVFFLHFIFFARLRDLPLSDVHQHHLSPTFVVPGQTVLVEGLVHWTSSVVAAPRTAF